MYFIKSIDKNHFTNISNKIKNKEGAIMFNSIGAWLKSLFKESNIEISEEQKEIFRKSPEFRKLTYLDDASNLITPYLKLEGFKNFERKNKELLNLQKQIKVWNDTNYQKQKDDRGVKLFGYKRVRLDDFVKFLYLRYDEICENHFKLKTKTT